MAVRPETSGSMAANPDDAWLEEIEHYRRPLTGYCYRMLGKRFLGQGIG